MAGASAVLALEEREAVERARLEALFKQLGLRKHCCDDGEPADGTCTCVYARVVVCLGCMRVGLD